MAEKPWCISIGPRLSEDGAAWVYADGSPAPLGEEGLCVEWNRSEVGGVIVHFERSGNYIGQAFIVSEQELADLRRFLERGPPR
jgi:hypothetical protein